MLWSRKQQPGPFWFECFGCGEHWPARSVETVAAIGRLHECCPIPVGTTVNGLVRFDGDCTPAEVEAIHSALLAQPR